MLHFLSSGFNFNSSVRLQTVPFRGFFKLFRPGAHGGDIAAEENGQLSISRAETF
jgi:hypothetical protein